MINIYLRQRSYLVPAQARCPSVRCSLGISVNTQFFQLPSTLVFGNGVGTRVQRVGYNNDHRVLMCDTVFVSSGAVHCFVRAVKLMLQNGV